ncbi:MAG TPA: hypothetical protein VFY87_22285 [Geminicoccaceae bacterium]|nr:hypothetical protein [Geminicoccaceae bacterium]
MAVLSEQIGESGLLRSASSSNFDRIRMDTVSSVWFMASAAVAQQHRLGPCASVAANREESS